MELPREGATLTFGTFSLPTKHALFCRESLLSLFEWLSCQTCSEKFNASVQHKLINSAEENEKIIICLIASSCFVLGNKRKSAAVELHRKKIQNWKLPRIELISPGVSCFLGNWRVSGQLTNPDSWLPPHQIMTFPNRLGNEIAFRWGSAIRPCHLIVRVLNRMFQLLLGCRG